MIRWTTRPSPGRKVLPPPSPRGNSHLPVPRALAGGRAGSIRARARRGHGAGPRADVVTPVPGAPPALPGRVPAGSAPHRPPFPAPPPAAPGARGPSTYWRYSLGVFAELPPGPALLPPASARPSRSHRRRAAPAAPRRSPRPEEPRGLPPTPPAAGLPHPGVPRLFKGSHWPGGRRVSQPAPSRG